MSTRPDQNPEMGFRRYTGEPNKREDLEAFGLVIPGLHHDIKTAIINIGGQLAEIRVTPLTSTIETILRPNKVDFRGAIRNLTSDRSLRPLDYRCFQDKVVNKNGV